MLEAILAVGSWHLLKTVVAAAKITFSWSFCWNTTPPPTRNIQVIFLHGHVLPTIHIVFNRITLFSVVILLVNIGLGLGIGTPVELQLTIA